MLPMQIWSALAYDFGCADILNIILCQLIELEWTAASEDLRLRNCRAIRPTRAPNQKKQDLWISSKHAMQVRPMAASETSSSHGYRI